MQQPLMLILDIQELDMQMIQLMKKKDERLNELEQMRTLKAEFSHQVESKQKEVVELKKNKRACETEIVEISGRIKRLEDQQEHIKKADEYNANSTALSAANRGLAALDAKLNDITEALFAEDVVLQNLVESLSQTHKESVIRDADNQEAIVSINKEGTSLKETRAGLAKEAPLPLLHVYEKLLNNKKDRVVVPIDNRTCGGCHITLTAQQENLVRKGERLTFCEHCSRILHGAPQNSEEAVAGANETTQRRRRRTINAV